MKFKNPNIRTISKHRVKISVFRLGIILSFVLMVNIGCAQGTYPIDFFYEMHYQPSHHSQEPPRLMPAPGSVPITGKEVPLELDPGSLDTITNPMPGQGIEHGRQLFSINCAMCHGSEGLGDGQVLKTMIEKYDYTPKLNVNLTLVNVFGYSDGKLYATITNRDLRQEIKNLEPGTNVVMPQFHKLLTSDERWMIVNYLKTLGNP